MQRTLIAVIAVSVATSSLAYAASDPIPQAVAAYIDDMKQTCEDSGGTPIAPAKTFLLSGHFRDAAHLDWAIDEGGFNCQGAQSIFSGSGGAQVTVFDSSPGEGASQAFQHGAYGMRVEHRSSGDVLWLNVGGPLCGQSGSPSHADSIECKRPLLWTKTGQEFEFAPLSIIKIISRP